MSKKLTPTMRVTYEGHKNAIKKQPIVQEQLETNQHLDKRGKYSISTPESYVKQIMIEDDIALGKFFEKIITLASCQGFVAFMMLYQYMYDKHLLGKEIEELTGQEIINHIYGEKAYRLEIKDRQTFLCSIVQLSGLHFYMESAERTQEIRKKKGSENNYIFKDFTLLRVKEVETLRDKTTLKSIRGVSIMKDFINLWYKKMSRLLIPLEDILKISRDNNRDHRRGFHLSLALRHAELGKRKDTVEWDLEQCLNVGQWSIELRRKTQAWTKVLESLREGKEQELIDYELVYQSNKPQELRYLKTVRIKRLWKTQAEDERLGFVPEQLSKRKTTKDIISF